MFEHLEKRGRRRESANMYAPVQKKKEEKNEGNDSFPSSSHTTKRVTLPRRNRHEKKEERKRKNKKQRRITHCDILGNARSNNFPESRGGQTTSPEATQTKLALPRRGRTQGGDVTEDGGARDPKASIISLTICRTRSVGERNGDPFHSAATHSDNGLNCVPPFVFVFFPLLHSLSSKADTGRAFQADVSASEQINLLAATHRVTACRLRSRPPVTLSTTMKI